jgi:putative ABC transport system permease protein
VTDAVDTTTVRAAIVSAHFFDVLRPRLALGRPLGPGDDDAALAVVSDRLWRTRLGARGDIVGGRVTLNGWPYAVIGVAAPQFHFPADDIDVWVPLGFAASSAPPRWKMRGFRAFSMIGRLRAGVGARQATDDATQTARWLEQTYPRFNERMSVSVTPLAARLTAAVRPALLMLFAAVGLVLIVACANVANMSLARNAARSREIAIRIAVGASRGHLVAQFIAESAVLAFAGGAVGLLVAQWCLQALTVLHPAGLPRLDEICLDLPVLAFTLAATVVATVLFGTLPGVTASRRPAALDLGDVRSTSNPRIRRWHAALIVAEIGISVILLVGGVLLTRSFVALTRAEIGVRRDRVLTVKLDLTSPAFSQPENATAFLGRALSAVESIPSVQSAGIVSSLPPNVSQMHTSFSLPESIDGRRG